MHRALICSMTLFPLLRDRRRQYRVCNGAVCKYRVSVPSFPIYLISLIFCQCSVEKRVCSSLRGCPWQGVVLWGSIPRTTSLGGTRPSTHVTSPPRSSSCVRVKSTEKYDLYSHAADFPIPVRDCKKLMSDFSCGYREKAVCALFN